MEKNFIQVNGIMSQGYGFSPKLIMRDTRLTIEAKAIYAYMSSFAGAGMSSFPTVSLQLAELKISKTRYYKHRKLLEDLGYITIQQTRIKNQNGKNVVSKNIYTLEQFPVEKIDKNNNSEIPQNKDTDESIENTQLSVIPQNEDTQNEDTQNEDSNSNTLNNNNFNNNNFNKSSSSTDDEDKIKSILCITQKCNYKVKRATIEKLLLIYDYNKITKAIITAATIGKDIKNYDSYLLATLNDLEKQKITQVMIDNKEKVDTFNNYDQRKYDFNKLEKDLLGWN